MIMTTFAFHHVGLSVGNVDAQQRFYRDAFGLTPEQQAEIPRAGVRMAILHGPNGLRIELVERTGSTEQNFADVYDGASVQGYFHFAVQVADLDTTYDDVLSAGATSVSAPAAATMLPGLRYAYVKDPEGNLIELLGR
jgi:catechol 2,3-dioxygenase-like lactoylglutathione lyase family enzyme